MMMRAVEPLGVEEELRLPRIAVLGAGHVGPVIARVAVAAGYHVTITPCA
jgi:glutamate dehydrogenase/leucine dehydrogenase